MEKKIVERMEFLFQEGEARTILHCLNYVAGRTKKGKAKKLQEYIRPTQIDNLRGELRKAIGL